MRWAGSFDSTLHVVPWRGHRPHRRDPTNATT